MLLHTASFFLGLALFAGSTRTLEHSHHIKGLRGHLRHQDGHQHHQRDADTVQNSGVEAHHHHSHHHKKHHSHHSDNEHHHHKHHGKRGIELPEDKMKVDEALMVMPPQVQDLYKNFQKKKTTGNAVMDRLKQVYERAQLDRDILEINCKDRKEDLAFEVKSARLSLMAAESDRTRLANRMQSLQLKTEQLSNEVGVIGQQFKMHRTVCDQTKWDSAAQLALLSQDLPLAKKVLEKASTACQGGTAPALLECGMPDGTTVVTFKEKADRTTIAQMSPVAERFVSLSLERAVHGHSAEATTAAFLGLGSHSGQRLWLHRGRHGGSHIDLMQLNDEDGDHDGHHHHHDHDDGSSNSSIASARRHASPVKRLLLQRRLPSSLCKAVEKAPKCEGLMDAMATFVGNVQDSVDELQDRAEQSGEHCERSLEDYESQMREVNGRIRAANTMLSNGAAEGSDLDAERKRREESFDALNKEATRQVQMCAHQSEEIASTMCGVRRLRKEMATLDTSLPKFKGECEVTEWIKGPCTSSCGVPGGGKQNITREIITQPAESTCPPLRIERTCNDKACPVDCLMDLWSPWTKCSKSCGGGSRSRQRTIRREPAGGIPCAETAQEVTCNTHACDLDCKLTEWTEWSGCSKACEKGHQVRTRQVLVPSLGEGKCPRKTSLDRRESKTCNKVTCKEALGTETPKCATKLDVVFVVDSSGSVGEAGFKKVQEFVGKALDRSKLGEQHMKVGVVQFGSTASVEADLSADAAATKTKVNAMTWQKSNTNTAEALAVARDVLTQGRQEAPSVAVVITDGMPTSKYLTATAVSRVHKRAIRLLFVTVGNGVNKRVMKQWASWPPKENVVSVPSFKELDEKLVTKILANICPVLEK